MRADDPKQEMTRAAATVEVPDYEVHDQVDLDPAHTALIVVDMVALRPGFRHDRESERCQKPELSRDFAHAGGKTRIPDTRIMIGENGEDLAYSSHFEVLLGPPSYARTDEFGARLGAWKRRKRKRRISSPD